MGRGNAEVDYLPDGRVDEALAQIGGVADMPNGDASVRSILESACREAETMGDYGLGDLVARTVSALSGQLSTHPADGMRQVEEIVVSLVC